MTAMVRAVRILALSVPLVWIAANHHPGGRPAWRVDGTEPSGAARRPAPECPRDGELRLPATGRIANATVTAADGASCWRRLNDNVTLVWPREGATVPGGADGVAEAVAAAMTWVQRAYDSYLELFDTDAAALASRHGSGSVVVAFQPAIRTSAAALGGFHHFDPGSGRSVVYLNLDPEATSARGTPWPLLAPHTIAHELFHAFHYQLRGASFERPYRWLTESLADWAARRVLEAENIYTPDGVFIYHLAMGRLFDEIGRGLLALDYPAHLFFHDQAMRHGDARIAAALAAHTSRGRNEDALAALDVRAEWHDFARHLLNRAPWRRLRDTPPLPDEWELPSDLEVEVETKPYCSEPETITMPALSARRVTIRLPARPEQLAIQLAFPDPGADPGGLRVSAAAYPAAQPYDLVTGVANLLCFSDSDPACRRASPLPATERIELIVSNHDLRGRLRPRLRVCTSPAELPGRPIRIGAPDAAVGR